MNAQQLVTASHTETEDLGRRIGCSLQVPAVILLEGSLGAGKTALTRGIVKGLGCDPAVVHSPTFSLINEYRCREADVYHVDLYRLDSLQDLYSIGLEEIVTCNAVIIIEWAEKLLFKVDTTLKITIEVTGDETRRFTILRPQN
jgi:tRNA threonylcarbamoyladenosine biosynthesis protein TsaE